MANAAARQRTVTDKTCPHGKAITRNVYPEIECLMCDTVIPRHTVAMTLYWGERAGGCGGGTGWTYFVDTYCMVCAVEDEEIQKLVKRHGVQSTWCQSCGRPLVLGTWYRPIQPYCSPLCYQRAKKGVKQEAVTCGCCGDTFMPKRSDSKYCSSKCRQKAYRGRAVENRADG